MSAAVMLAGWDASKRRQVTAVGPSATGVGSKTGPAGRGAGCARRFVDCHRLGQPSHARVLEFDDLAPGIRLELPEDVQQLFSLAGATEPLHRLRRAICGAAQSRVERQRLPVPGQRACEIILLEPASGGVVHRERICRILPGYEYEMRQRVGRTSVVEQEQAQTVASPEVSRIRGGDALEDPARLVGVAFPLTVQCRDRQVDLQVESIGVRGRQTHKNVAGGVVVELSHQSDAAVVQADHVVGRRAPVPGIRTGDRDDQPHGGEEPAGPACRGTGSHGAQGRPV